MCMFALVCSVSFHAMCSYKLSMLVCRYMFCVAFRMPFLVMFPEYLSLHAVYLCACVQSIILQAMCVSVRSIDLCLHGECVLMCRTCAFLYICMQVECLCARVQSSWTFAVYKCTEWECIWVYVWMCICVHMHVIIFAVFACTTFPTW